MTTIGKQQNKLRKPNANNVDSDMMYLEKLTSLMDDRFRIPGTSFRFGLDAIIGLIPYVGDLVTFLISAYLIGLISRRGSNNKLIFLMMINVLIDTAIGMIPLLGDIFDFRFRANRKNLKLAQEFISEGRHQGSIWILLFLWLMGFFVIVLLSIWLVRQSITWVFS